MSYFRPKICAKMNVETDINKGFKKTIYSVNSSVKGDIKVIEKMEIFWKLQNLALKLRKRIFGSENVMNVMKI